MNRAAIPPVVPQPAAQPAAAMMQESRRSPDSAERRLMKVLVVDDHPLILQALARVLKHLQADVQVLNAATASDGRAVLDEHPDADLLLLDLALPGTDGFELLAELRAAHPAVPVVVLSASERQVDVLRALDMGAMGYIPKTSSNAVLLQALRLVLSGGVYVPSAAVARGPEAARAASRARDISLTRRQAEVLACMLQGLPNKLICRRLGLGEGTVKIHVAAILRALNVRNRTQAVIEASRRGFTIDRLPGEARGPAPLAVGRI
jgi:DNA-binding NarL/FixJ family response regulator